MYREIVENTVAEVPFQEKRLAATLTIGSNGMIVMVELRMYLAVPSIAITWIPVPCC